MRNRFLGALLVHEELRLRKRDDAFDLDNAVQGACGEVSDERANHVEVGATLPRCVDSDEFTAARRRIGLCPSVNRAPDLK